MGKKKIHFFRNRFKSFEVCMGFCASDRPEVTPAGNATEPGPPQPPVPVHPGVNT
jgi:hypothetical protein